MLPVVSSIKTFAGTKMSIQDELRSVLERFRGRRINRHLELAIKEDLLGILGRRRVVLSDDITVRIDLGNLGPGIWIVITQRMINERTD